MSLMFKFSWELLFLESRNTEILNAAGNKLFVSNEKHIDNHTIMLDMLYSYMSVVYTYHCRGVFKSIFWYGCCYLLIFVAKKATKGSELQFLCTQGTFQGGRVTEHRMMFARQFHQLQSCS